MNAQHLDKKQQSLVAISSNTANGNLPELKTAVNQGLDNGLTINEIKEAMVQLYAYCGFPKSLNAINTLKTVTEERQKSGKKDVEGKAGNVENKVADKYEQGRKTLEVLTKTKQQKPAPGFGEFAPRIDNFLKEHLFADIFANDVLNHQQRELVTISALATMEGAEGQLKSHIEMGKNTGITDSQITEIQQIAKNNKDMNNNEVPKISEFPVGKSNDEYAKYFNGKSWLAPLTKMKELNAPVSNVTFEPGSRNNWHSHTGGQILIAVGGEGYYQERGKPAQKLKEGDLVEIAPNVEHWHGAAPNSWFSHLAIATNPQTDENTWLEPVSDSEYEKATK